MFFVTYQYSLRGSYIIHNFVTFYIYYCYNECLFHIQSWQLLYLFYKDTFWGLILNLFTFIVIMFLLHCLGSTILKIKVDEWRISIVHWIENLTGNQVIQSHQFLSCGVLGFKDTLHVFLLFIMFTQIQLLP